MSSENLNPVEDVIFVIDDDASVREGLGEMIGALGFPVQVYPSAEEFLSKMPRNATGCVILDVFMPGMTGLDLQRKLNATDVYLPIVFLTGRGDIPMTVHALKAGAAQFLTKPPRAQDLFEAIKEALYAGRRARSEKAELTEIRLRIESLAPREREVMNFVVSGRLNKEIAYEMGISERTVKLYRARVMEKMAAGSLADLIKRVERVGLREPEAMKLSSVDG